MLKSPAQMCIIFVCVAQAGEQSRRVSATWCGLCDCSPFRKCVEPRVYILWLASELAGVGCFIVVKASDWYAAIWELYLD